MNLAEIRRKAQAAEAQGAEAAQFQPAAAVAAPVAPPAAPALPQAVAVAVQAPALSGLPLPEELPVLPAAVPAPPAPQMAPPALSPETASPAQAPAAQAAQTAPVFQEPPMSREPLAPVQPVPPGLPLYDDFEPSDPADWTDPYATPPTSAWSAPPEPAMPDFGQAAGFDPAALIIQGRESAGSEDTVQEVEQAEASLELLCFTVANEEYAISIMDIKEIIKPREVTEVPRVPDFVRGILSLRGIIIPVFDMRLRLGLPAAERSERERVIVVKRQGGFCGVLVDQVVQVVRIPEAGVEAPPVVLEGIDREFILGIGRVSDRMLILLDMEKVLDVGLL